MCWSGFWNRITERFYEIGNGGFSMAVETLEQSVEKLESRIQEVEERLAEQIENAIPKKRGWRWFVGIYADSPDFDEVVRIGQEWRNADCPADDEDTRPQNRRHRARQ